MGAVGQLAQVVVAGLTSGSIYALVALGFTMIFAVSGFISLLQGEYVILGGLIAIALSQWLGLPLPVAILAAVAGASLFGAIFQRLTLSPKRNLSPDAALIVTLGGAFVARGTAMVVFGKDPLSLPSFSGERPVAFGEVVVATQAFWIIGTLAAIAAALWAFFALTYTGKAMQACSQNATGARLVGIDLNAMGFISFVASAAIGAIAGVVIAPLNFVSYDEGLAVGIKGFIAAVLGGLGSYPGAVAGGILLGLAEGLSAAYISSQFKDAIAFVILLVLLLFRPGGLWGATR